MMNLLNKIKTYFKKLMLFTTSYSLNVFDEPLTKEEEEYYDEYEDSDEDIDYDEFDEYYDDDDK